MSSCADRLLESRDQRPDRHQDEEQYQDHNDYRYEVVPAHRTSSLKEDTNGRPILAAGLRERQRRVLELVGVEYAARRRRRALIGELAAQDVKLLNLLGGEPYDGIGVGAQIQDRSPPRLHA